MPAAFAYGGVLAGILAAYNATGNKLGGYEGREAADELDRKEFMRKNRRRAMEETVSELGEGRGTKEIITYIWDT